MFLLRHYGRDWRERPAQGVLRARATARGNGAAVEVSVKAANTQATLACAETTHSHEGVGVLDAFEGVELDAAARGEIEEALLACAERARALEAQWGGTAEEKRAAIEGDADTGFIAIGTRVVHHDAFLDPLPGMSEMQRDPVYRGGEPEWSEIGATAEVRRPRRRKRSS